MEAGGKVLNHFSPFSNCWLLLWLYGLYFVFLQKLKTSGQEEGGR